LIPQASLDDDEGEYGAEEEVRIIPDRLAPSCSQHSAQGVEEEA
jgi:hypothetical protein